MVHGSVLSGLTNKQGKQKKNIPSEHGQNGLKMCEKAANVQTKTLKRPSAILQNYCSRPL